MQEVTIPLHIARAGLTEEYVEARTQYHKLRDALNEKRKECGQFQNRMEKIAFWQHGTRTLKNPAEMKFTDVIILHEMTSEMLELRGEYEEIKRALNEAEEIIKLTNEKAKEAI